MTRREIVNILFLVHEEPAETYLMIFLRRDAFTDLLLVSEGISHIYFEAVLLVDNFILFFPLHFVSK